MNEIRFPFGKANIGVLTVADAATSLTPTDNLEIWAVASDADLAINLIASDFLTIGASVIINLENDVEAEGDIDITFGSTVVGSSILATDSDYIFTFVYNGSKFLLTSAQAV